MLSVFRYSPVFFAVLHVTISPKSRRILEVFVAYFRKIDDKWRTEVERGGVRTSKRFATKKEAELARLPGAV